jgi:hypothetical protein
MAVTRVDYSEQAVAAARSVLLELVHLLGEYRDSIVLIGGMVPRLLIPQAEESHIGTVDVDLALDHRRFEEAGYRTVHELLTSRGYERDDQQPFIYRRRFNLEGRPVTVQVDLLSGEYGGTGRSRRTQRVQDVRPRKARGAELAFEQPLDVEISGALPDGGEDNASVRVAAIVPFLIMKSMALRDRLKEKDAYDIYTPAHPLDVCLYPLHPSPSSGISDAICGLGRPPGSAQSGRVIRWRLKRPALLAWYKRAEAAEIGDRGRGSLAVCRT